MDLPNLVVYYGDIEVIAPIDVKFPSPELAEFEIGAISFYDTINKTFTTLYLDDYAHFERIRFKFKDIQKKDTDANWVRIAFSTEMALLEAFIETFKAIDPDIVTFWNAPFDIPYLVNRCNNLGIYINAISPTENINIKDREIEIEGRLVLDMLWGYKIIRKPLSDGIEFAAGNEGLEGKYGTTREALAAYETDRNEFLLYSIHDIRMMVQIDQIVNVTMFFIERKQSVGMNGIVESNVNSLLVETLDLRLCYYLNICENSRPRYKKGERIREDYRGALVFEPPRHGIFNIVGTLDYEKYYPTIQEKLNLSKETIDPNGDIHFGDLRLTNRKTGLAVLVYYYFRSQREKFEDRLKLETPGSLLFGILTSKFQNFKDLSNSVWGTISYARGRMFHIQLAKAITKMGRYGILWIKKRAAEAGYTVATGDTDSVLIEFLIYNIDIMKDFAKKITTSLPFLFKKLTGMKITGVTLALERVSSKVIFVKKTDGSGIAKKKRSERVIWEKGKECDYVRITGFEYKRRDQSIAIKDMQWDVLNMILYNKEHEVFDHLLKIVKKFDPKTADINEIKMSKGIGKFLDKYGGIGKGGRRNPIPPHIVAAKYSNEFLKKNYEIGSQLNYVFIKRMPHPYPQTEILSFDEIDDIPKGTIIDYDEHLSKMKNKIERIVETLGLTWTNIITGTLGMSPYALKYNKRR